MGDAAAAKARVQQLFTDIAQRYGSVLDLFDVFGRGLVGAVDLRLGERVLDLACGRGACLRPASKAVGPRGYVLGVDLSPAMVELATEELRRDDIANAEVRVGDAEHLDVADRSFDAVTCGFGVFFFPQPAASAEARRVLRAGGRFAASTFNDERLDYPWLPEVINDLGVLGDMRTRSGSTAPMLRADGLASLLEEVGFDRVTVTTSEHRFVFVDVDAYLLWVHSQAYGVLLASLDEEGQQRFREMCAERLQAHQAADGYELIKRVDFTVAYRQ
jgi:O-methyltransferase/aklanonic acid methyltransferase